MKGRVRAQSFLNLILNSTTEKAEEGGKVYFILNGFYLRIFNFKDNLVTRTQLLLLF